MDFAICEIYQKVELDCGQKYAFCRLLKRNELFSLVPGNSPGSKFYSPPFPVPRGAKFSGELATLVRMAAKCIITLNNNVANVTTSVLNKTDDCLEVQLEDMTDESVQVIGLTSQWSMVLVAVLIGCVVLNTAGKAFIIYFVKKRALDRPINTMVLIDQVLNFITRIYSNTK